MRRIISILTVDIMRRQLKLKSKIWNMTPPWNLHKGSSTLDTAINYLENDKYNQRHPFQSLGQLKFWSNNSKIGFWMHVWPMKSQNMQQDSEYWPPISKFQLIGQCLNRHKCYIPWNWPELIITFRHYKGCCEYSCKTTEVIYVPFNKIMKEINW